MPGWATTDRSKEWAREWGVGGWVVVGGATTSGTEICTRTYRREDDIASGGHHGGGIHHRKPLFRALGRRPLELAVTPPVDTVPRSTQSVHEELYPASPRRPGDLQECDLTHLEHRLCDWLYASGDWVYAEREKLGEPFATPQLGVAHTRVENWRGVEIPRSVHPLIRPLLGRELFNRSEE